jgi:hypothetical protein
MRILIILLLLGMSTIGTAQTDERTTVIDFVEILNDNHEEALYYFENNWLALRKKAIDKGYIDSYQLLETPYSEAAPFHFMLITTYANQEQYDQSEDRFVELIEEKGPLQLLNAKQPGEFRKIVFYKEMVRHLH